MEMEGERGGGRTDARLFHDGSVAGGNSTAEQADLIKGSLRVDGDDGDVGYDGVLRKCRGAHLYITFYTYLGTEPIILTMEMNSRSGGWIDPCR